MEKIIELQNVWKIYQLGETKVEALRGVSIMIKRGEFIALIGPSGSGKSTAMHMIGCLDLPSRGKLSLHGQDITKMHESELAQMRGKTVGFIFQFFNLIGTLTALENVMLPMIFQHMSREEREEKAKKLLKLISLGERMHHLPSQLSGGEQQRVAIARALANDPDIILADEPTGNLDTKTGHNIMKLFSEIHKEGKTIVMVTHEPDIADYAKRIIHIKDGQIFKDSIKRKRR